MAPGDSEGPGRVVRRGKRRASAVTDPDRMPAAMRAYAGILLRPRAGLDDPARMPALERVAQGVRLDPAWLASYRACVGLPAPERDDGALPPLALQIAAAPLHLALLADAAFPFRALGIVHLAQHVQQHAPVRLRDVIDLHASTGLARRERRGIAFDIVTRAAVGDRTCWQATATALVRDRRSGQHGREHEMPSRAADLRDGRVHGAEMPGEPGLDNDPAHWRRVAELALPASLGRRDAAIAGDLNPIHQHAWLARPFGFPRAIVHGTWTLARALAAAGWPRADAWEADARFRKPVLLPSTVRVETMHAAGARALRVTDTTGQRLHLQATLDP